MDCSQVTLAEAVKHLEEANLHIKSFEMHDNSLIRDIPAKLFSKLSISQLDFSGNYIARVDPNAFVGQEESLTDINLSNNSLSVLPNWSLLKNLENLDLSGNTISNIQDNVFAQNRQLKTLRIERNRICNLYPNALNETKQQLELLDLSNNCFSNVPASSLRNFQKLAYLDLSANRITDVPNLQFMNMPSLRELRLNDNSIQNIQSLAFMNVPNLELLNLARNKLQSLDTNRFQSFDNLAVMDLTGNRLSKIVTSAYSNMKSLKQLLLDDNNITTVETLAISSLPQLQLVTMQRNNLQSLSRNAFDSLPSMQVLLLGGNKLQGLDAGMMSGMPTLQQLNLHDNNLTAIQPSTFDPVPQLTTLDLGRNKIQTLSPDLFKKLAKLFWLDLSQNRLSSLDTGTFSTKISNMILQGNSWQCDTKLDWFVNWLVANNVRTFLPGQPEVTCAGPPDYAGTLLKDLMIKKANDTFFKTLGGAQGLFGNNGLGNIPGLNFLSGLDGSATGADGTKIGASSLLDAIVTPVNNLVGAGMVTDLVKSLPGLIANFPKVGGGAGTGGLLGGGGLGEVGGLDISKIPPGVIQYVMNGGQIPGVSPETMQRLIQQYLQQLSKTLPAINNTSPGSVLTSPSQQTDAKASNGSNNAGVLITESLPLPPLSSLPPELVQSVMSGGLIPGMNREQTDALKARYMQQLFGTGPVTGSDSSLSISNGSLPNITTNTIGTGAGFSLADLPTDLLRGLNLSEISPQVLQDLAAGRVPDLGRIPPDLVQTLINKRPELFGQMVDKLLQEKIDASGALNAILGKLPPIQQAPVPATGAPYDVNELDYKGDLGYFNQKNGNQNNMGLWTGLGLGVVALLTVATVLYLCFKRRRSRRTEETDGTKLFSTPRSSAASILPVQSNNNLPPFFAPSQNYSNSAHDYSNSAHNYSKPAPCAQDYSRHSAHSKHDYSKQSYGKSADYSNPAYCKAFDSSTSDYSKPAQAGNYSNPGTAYSKPGTTAASDSWHFGSPNYKKTEM